MNIVTLGENGDFTELALNGISLHDQYLNNENNYQVFDIIFKTIFVIFDCITLPKLSLSISVLGFLSSLSQLSRASHFSSAFLSQLYPSPRTSSLHSPQNLEGLLLSIEIATLLQNLVPLFSYLFGELCQLYRLKSPLEIDFSSKYHKNYLHLLKEIEKVLLAHLHHIYSLNLHRFFLIFSTFGQLPLCDLEFFMFIVQLSLQAFDFLNSGKITVVYLFF